MSLQGIKPKYEPPTVASGIEPVFEITELFAGHSVLNCWYQTADGRVYRNRELTSYIHLPFYTAEQVVNWVYLGAKDVWGRGIER